MSEYLTPNAEPNYHKYELYGVVIHRGSAQGGHYFCYARDLLHETDWESGLVETNQQEAKVKNDAEAKEKEK